MSYKKISSGTSWEGKVGYSRAVQIENLIEVSGTVATEEGQNVGIGDPYEQTKFILQKIEAVLKECGADLQNVVRTRIYVTDISRWEEVGRAHGEFFKDIRPATSMVQVAALIHEDYLVEIEATAIVPD